MERTYIFETRCDIRTVAALAMFLRRNGYTPRTRSEFGSTCLDTLMEILVANGKVERITSSVEAEEIVKRMRLMGRGGSRVTQELVKQIGLEQIEGIEDSLVITEDDFDDMVRKAAAAGE